MGSGGGGLGGQGGQIRAQDLRRDFLGGAGEVPGERGQVAPVGPQGVHGPALAGEVGQEVGDAGA
jgi:hypothetical protein